MDIFYPDDQMKNDNRVRNNILIALFSIPRNTPKNK